MRAAARAATRLVWTPLDFRQAVRFADAVADTWLVRTLYLRLADGLDPAHAARIRALNATPIDLAALLALPPNTFGHAFARFIRDNGIAVGGQVKACPELADTLAHNWVMDRFVRVHDFHHTLFGVSADPVSEAALQAFNFANFREPFGAMGIVATPLVMRAYGEWRRTVRGTVRGIRTGRACPNLLWHPYEEWWADDLDVVRARVGIARE
ncbi:MAG: Coq4 family protein, partial [Myxococcota bacterium]